MSTPTVRAPWIAVILSLAATGLGQIYCGRIRRGLMMFLGSSLFAPLIVIAALLPSATVVLLGLLLALAAVLGLYVFAIVDAFRLARRRELYEPKEYNHLALYALFIVVGLTYPAGVLYFIRSNVFEAFLIPSASEVPTLLPADRVLVNKTTRQWRYPRRGDLVVFRVASREGRNWIKRIIALPGDTVEVKANEVIVNGEKLQRDRLPLASLGAVTTDVEDELFEETNAGLRYRILIKAGTDPLPDHPSVKVPDGTCFVLGDNRNKSRDSRTVGFVALGDVLGDVQYVYWPAVTWSRFGVISH